MAGNGNLVVTGKNGDNGGRGWCERGMRGKCGRKGQLPD